MGMARNGPYQRWGVDAVAATYENLEQEMMTLPDGLQRFLASLVEPHGCAGPPDDPDLAIDLLERAIEVHRIERGRLENQVPFEWFLQGHLSLSSEKLHFAAPPAPKGLGSGTQPIALQPALLVFLLLTHNRHRRILDCIEAFVRAVWDQLDPLDFKRTRTGVLRCVTNTRVAANKLRDYGLLKFTRHEAYKTWVLSLPGLLLAGELAPRGRLLIRRAEPTRGEPLHPEIVSFGPPPTQFDDFVRRLEGLCRPDSKHFRTFEGVLRRAHELLPGYWKAIRDPKATAKQRQEACQARLRMLEQHPDTERFYQQLAMSLRTAMIGKPE